MKNTLLLFGLLAFLLLPEAMPAACAKGDPVHGKQVFTAQTCGMCHVAGGNMICPEKPLKGASFQKKYPNDSMVADVIRHGVKGTSMDSFGKDKLPDADLQDVVAYIRSLTPPAAAGSAQSGKSAAPQSTKKSTKQPTKQSAKQPSQEPTQQLAKRSTQQSTQKRSPDRQSHGEKAQPDPKPASSKK